MIYKALSHVRKIVENKTEPIPKNFLKLSEKTDEKTEDNKKEIENAVK